MAKTIGVFSLEADLHAHSIVDRLRRSGALVAFVSTDNQFESGRLVYRPAERPSCQVRSADGTDLDIASIGALWWRRVNQPQLNVPESYDADAIHLIDNEWRAAMYGSINAVFGGTWINDPHLDVLAGNKAYQLQAAARAGFRVPATLISQDPEAVRGFCNDQGGIIIAKKLVGAPPKPLATIEVSADQLTDDEAISACPAIYQEKIVGGRHLRVHYFGGRILTALIESPLLDWRRDLSVPMTAFELPREVEGRVDDLMRALGLRMGVIDMMLTASGEFVWIELNTQGQFLFMEALAGLPLGAAMSDFLVQANSA
jgi:hypothetical protein